MYLNFQQVLAGGLAFTGLYKSKDDVISSGTITDYCVQKCLDAEGTVRGGNSGATLHRADPLQEEHLLHGKPRNIRGTLEVRDAKSNEIVYYRDTNGDYTAEKTELVLIDFMPKTPRLCNSTVDYTISTCK
ncbi:hypothetical protein EMMF5_001190 [Cystobasidiomycetes sp. EMM_F5]